MSGRARLLDSPRLIGQLVNLERRASPMGRDRIDHPAGAHDDLSNTAAGALVLASEELAYWANNMAWVWGDEPLHYGHPFFDQLGGLPRLR